MRTLCICAHPDDEALSCGGLILTRLSDRANVVKVLTLFGRKYGYGEGPQYAEEQYAAYKAALKALGSPQAHYHVLEEGEPQTQGYYRTLRIIEDELVGFVPDEVVVHSADDLNQDHRWLAECCRIALRPANLGDVTRVLTMLGIDGRLHPGINFFIPLTPVQMEQKQRAMACYHRESRVAPHPRASINLMAYHRLAGSQCGELFAEPYILTLQKEPPCASVLLGELDELPSARSHQQS
jgi:LmbE family N-acetylglucosaminyl deacetylase